MQGEASWQVYLPPVLTLHAIWSNSATWDAFHEYLKLTAYPAAALVNVDYSRFNAYSFSSDAIQTILELRIVETLRDLELRGIAAARVDLVGHSMGGLVSRYFEQANASRGLVRKIVTLGTPHFGSPLAD